MDVTTPGMRADLCFCFRDESRAFLVTQRRRGHVHVVFVVEWFEIFIWRFYLDESKPSWWPEKMVDPLNGI